VPDPLIFWKGPGLEPTSSASVMSTRKPFNSQSLISYLTNSNGCGILQSKVLLTVSPFRPFLLPQPRVCSRNRRLLPSYAPYASRMDLRDAPRNANISPILSTLRILPVATGVSGQRTPCHSFTPIFEGPLLFCFHNLTNPFSSNPLVFTSIQNPRGVTPSAFPAHAFAVSVLSVFLPAPTGSGL